MQKRLDRSLSRSKQIQFNPGATNNQFTLCSSSSQGLWDQFDLLISDQHCIFVSSRSFSQKRAAVEKDYALVRQSSLLLVCHSAALMFVETSFLYSSLASVPLLPSSLANRMCATEKKRQLCNRRRNVFRRCVKFVFSLSPDRSFRNRAVWKAPSVPRGRCSGSAARCGISSRSAKSWGSSVVGRHPALHDDAERRAHTCCCDSPRRRSSQADQHPLENLWVLFVHSLTNVAPAFCSAQCPVRVWRED